MIATLAMTALTLSGDPPDQRYYWTPKDFSIPARFTSSCRFFSSSEELASGRTLPVGLTPVQFDFAINEVYKRMVQPDLDHVPNRPVAELANMIKTRTLGVMRRLQIEDKPELLKKWLLAEGVCAWVATHVVADKELEKAPSNVRGPRGQASVVLSYNPPLAVCAGFNSLTRALSAAIGLDCRSLGGEARYPGNASLGHDNHGWDYFNFGNGVECVSDNTQGRVSLEQARRLNGKSHWASILPKSPLEWELFLGQHYSIQLIGEYVPERGGSRYKDTTEHAMMSMGYKEWGAVDTGYLKQAMQRFDAQDATRIKGLNAFTSIQAARV